MIVHKQEHVIYYI